MQRRLVSRSPVYYGWVVLGAASSATFARNAAASLTIAVFVYPLSQELGWSRSLIAGAAAVGGLAATFASPFVGALIDRFGTRPVLSFSILLLCATTALLAWSDVTTTLFATTVPWVFYIAYATGRVLFSSPLQIGASVVVSRWFVRLRGRTNGILNLSHSLGMVAFPLVASVVIAHSGWRDAWFALAAIVSVVAVLPVVMLIVEKPEDVGLAPDGDASNETLRVSTAEDSNASEMNEVDWTSRSAMRAPTLWLVAIATGLLFLMHAGVNTHSAAFFRDQGLGAIVAGVGISFNAITLGVGSLIWGRVVEKASPRYVLAAVALVMAAGSMLFTSTDTAIEAFTYSAIFGFGLGGMLTVPPVAYADYFGRASLGTIRGVTEPFTTFGQAVGVMIPGVVFDYLGDESYLPFFFAAAVAGVVAAAISLFAGPPKRTDSHAVSRRLPDNRTESG